MMLFGVFNTVFEFEIPLCKIKPKIINKRPNICHLKDYCRLFEYAIMSIFSFWESL